jgi:hypothetical protein
VSLSQEVVMRPPEVFVRELSPQEGARLKSISKRAKYQAKRQRAMIVLASATLMSAPEIARLMRTDESHVRKVIHAFDEEGFDSLDPDYRGGRSSSRTPTTPTGTRWPPRWPSTSATATAPTATTGSSKPNADYSSPHEHQLQAQHSQTTH